jgi:hypothetical protein
MNSLILPILKVLENTLVAHYLLTNNVKIITSSKQSDRLTW